MFLQCNHCIRANSAFLIISFTKIINLRAAHMFFPGLGTMNLCLDSMDVMKIVLLVFEAMLLTDCVRGKGADSQMF